MYPASNSKPTSSSQDFSDFANTLSFYKIAATNHSTNGYSNPSMTPGPFSPSGASTVSLENKPSTYGTAAAVSTQEGVSGAAGSEGFLTGLLNSIGGNIINGSNSKTGNWASGSSSDNIDDSSGNNVEYNGLIKYAKLGYEMAREGVTNIGSTGTTIINNSSTKIAVTTSSMSPWRYVYFTVGILIGCLFFFLSFMFLPLIVIAPSKFALMFTLGSLSFMFSLGFLKGFSPFLQHIFSKNRLPFTFAYAGSLAATLYVTLVDPSRILALLFSLIQIGALFSFLISYIPGGTNMLKFMGNTTISLVTSFFKRSTASPSSTLPL